MFKFLINQITSPEFLSFTATSGNNQSYIQYTHGSILSFQTLDSTHDNIEVIKVELDIIWCKEDEEAKISCSVNDDKADWKRF